MGEETYGSRYLGEFTEEQARELYDAHGEIEEAIREWLRESDSDFVDDEMGELEGFMSFEVDSWCNVWGRPGCGASDAGAFAKAVRGSMFGYPSAVEPLLEKLERYAEGVERLGGWDYCLPGHFEEAILGQMQEVVDVYSRCFKDEYDWWMDASSDDLFANYFMDDVDGWISRCPDVECELEEMRDEEDEKRMREEEKKRARRARRWKRRRFIERRAA